MKINLIFLLSIAFLISCGDKETIIYSENKDNTVELSGIILNKVTNEVIPNAIVSTIPYSEIILSDKEGKFTFPSLEKKDYLIIVEADNFYDSYISIDAEKDNVNAILTLNPVVKNNKIPTKPFLYNILNLKSENTYKTQINWNSIDPEENFVIFDVLVDTQNPPVKIIAKDIVEPKITFDKINSNKLYIQIIAKDRQGAINKSHIVEFDNTKLVDYDLRFNEIFSFPLDKDLFYFNLLDDKFYGLDSTLIFATNRFNKKDKALKIQDSIPTTYFIPYVLTNDLEYTISFWLKANTNYFGDSENDLVTLITLTNLAKNPNSISFKLKSNGELYFNLSQPFPENSLSLKTSISINNNLWNHVCVVKNGNIYMLYLNGILEMESTLENFDLPASNIYFGANPFNKSLFYGYLDDFIYFDKAFKRSEILDLFNN